MKQELVLKSIWLPIIKFEPAADVYFIFKEAVTWVAITLGIAASYRTLKWFQQKDLENKINPKKDVYDTNEPDPNILINSKLHGSIDIKSDYKAFQETIDFNSSTDEITEPIKAWICYEKFAVSQKITVNLFHSKTGEFITKKDFLISDYSGKVDLNLLFNKYDLSMTIVKVTIKNSVIADEGINHIFLGPPSYFD